MALTTIARARALAGFRPKRVTGESLGTGNGVNIVMTPKQFAYFVSPDHDTPETDEVKVYVNGTAVGVSTLSESAVVLSTAPADGAAITMDYWGSNLSNSEVRVFITEVDSQLMGLLCSRYTPEELTKSPLVSKIAAYLSAAAIVDEGFMMGGMPSNSVYPPDRLRKVANDLLTQIASKTISLLDGENLPLVEAIESWISNTNYTDKDRVFEADPFDVDAFGRQIIETIKTPFDWS
jgi:hypothetical protein